MHRSISIAAALWVAASFGAAAQECPTTTTEENGQLVRDFVEAVYNQHDPSAVPQFLAEDYEQINYARPQANEAGLADEMARVERAVREVPDLHNTIEKMIVSGDTVVILTTHSGTNLGAFEGWDTPATGRSSNWSGVQILRIECGKIAEGWVLADRLSQLRELGVITEDELRSVEAP